MTKKQLEKRRNTEQKQFTLNRLKYSRRAAAIYQAKLRHGNQLNIESTFQYGRFTAEEFYEPSKSYIGLMLTVSTRRFKYAVGSCIGEAKACVGSLVMALIVLLCILLWPVLDTLRSLYHMPAALKTYRQCMSFDKATAKKWLLTSEPFDEQDTTLYAPYDPSLDKDNILARYK